MEVGVVGLGSMGFAIAERLIDGGHAVTVWNRSEEKAHPLIAKGATLADSPEGTASGDIVISMLADDDAVRKVILGSKKREDSDEGVLAHQGKDTIHVSMSTISVDLCNLLKKQSQQQGKKFIAAPALGRPDVVSRGELLVMCGGDRKLIDQCKPAFDAFAKSVQVLGEEPAQAALAKLTANYILSCMIEIFSESSALLRKNDVDHEKFFEVIGPILFAPFIYEKYGKLILKEKYDSGDMTTRLQEKDTRLAMQAAIQSQVPMPFLGVLENAFLSAIGRGYSELDPCVLAQVAAENAGLTGKKNK